jgi:hypothetical protein
MCPPAFLAAHEEPVTDRRTRYRFEHGPDSLTARAIRSGMPVKLLSRTGITDWPYWRLESNGHWAGDQSDMLCGYSSTERFRHASHKVKIRMQRLADTLTDFDFGKRNPSWRTPEPTCI